jgi:hypothetical protein
MNEPNDEDRTAAHEWLKQHGDNFGRHFESDTDTVYDCGALKGRPCTCCLKEETRNVAALISSVRREERAAIVAALRNCDRYDPPSVFGAADDIEGGHWPFSASARIRGEKE